MAIITILAILFLPGFIVGVVLYFILRSSRSYIQETKKNILDHSYDGTIKDGTKNILIGEAIILAHGQNKKKKKNNKVKDLVSRGSMIYDEIYNSQVTEGKYLGD